MEGSHPIRWFHIGVFFRHHPPIKDEQCMQTVCGIEFKTLSYFWQADSAVDHVDCDALPGLQVNRHVRFFGVAVVREYTLRSIAFSCQMVKDKLLHSVDLHLPTYWFDCGISIVRSSILTDLRVSSQSFSCPITVGILSDN
jgi:hypothetical protein